MWIYSQPSATIHRFKYWPATPFFHTPCHHLWCNQRTLWHDLIDDSSLWGAFEVLNFSAFVMESIADKLQYVIITEDNPIRIHGLGSIWTDFPRAAAGGSAAERRSAPSVQVNKSHSARRESNLTPKPPVFLMDTWTLRLRVVHPQAPKTSHNSILFQWNLFNEI